MVVMLDMTSWSRDHCVGVAYASPPLTAPKRGPRRRQRDFSLRLLSWSVRRGRGRWGISAVAWKAG
jgi:hypothetical protein